MSEPKLANIDVHELKKRWDADPNLCVIDVRETHEWQALRIPGALHIPKDELTERIEALIPSLDKPIYLHCRGGTRSLYAGSCLLNIGYTEVYSIDGGISDWAAFGYPVEK